MPHHPQAGRDGRGVRVGGRGGVSLNFDLKSQPQGAPQGIRQKRGPKELVARIYYVPGTFLFGQDHCVERTRETLFFFKVCGPVICFSLETCELAGLLSSCCHS